MDVITRFFYEQAFQIAFLEKKGNEYQNWFADIMEMCYPHDFVRVCPWGSAGDRKNDGYLPSKRMLFQVYAPNELKESTTIRKIDEDFLGALPYWQDHFDTWVFVHNSRKGLSPGVTRKLLELDANQQPNVKPWGRTELRIEVFNLGESDLRHLFGVVPTMADLYNVQYENFANVLKYVSLKPPLADPDIQLTPFRKLDANGLSDESRYFVRLGQRKSHYVAEFFNQWYEPSYGDEVSASFKLEYIRLKSEGLSPDDIFWKLVIFTGGNKVTNSKDGMAVHALVAYFFWACDIFERPVEEKANDFADETPQ